MWPTIAQIPCARVRPVAPAPRPTTSGRRRAGGGGTAASGRRRGGRTSYPESRGRLRPRGTSPGRCVAAGGSVRPGRQTHLAPRMAGVRLRVSTGSPAAMARPAGDPLVPAGASMLPQRMTVAPTISSISSTRISMIAAGEPGSRKFATKSPPVAPITSRPSPTTKRVRAPEGLRRYGRIGGEQCDHRRDERHTHDEDPYAAHR